MIKTNLKMNRSLVLLSLTIAVLCLMSFSASAQTKCSTVGAIKRFEFENATIRDVDVRTVTENCKENPGKVLTRGEKLGGNAYIGTVFRAYEKDTNRLIREFVLDKAHSNFKVENCSRDGGTSLEVKFQNSMPREVVIRRVNADCGEIAVRTLKTGEIHESRSASNSVFRIYENGTNKLLDEMVVTGRNNVFRLENCSKTGKPRLIFIRNGGANEIEVRRVSEDCKEQKVAAVTPGRMFESKTFADNVYRVYEKETARLLEE
ncbi:MAG: hypothetical protein R2681_08710, partial [Pyrinomonadaceae bacterium]